MTEDEAKTKWCPFARVLAERENIAANRGSFDGSHANCIGSACMAFRHTRLGTILKNTETGEERSWLIDTTRTPPGWVIDRQEPDDCYCGLAGKP